MGVDRAVPGHYDVGVEGEFRLTFPARGIYRETDESAEQAATLCVGMNRQVEDVDRVDLRFHGDDCEQCSIVLEDEELAVGEPSLLVVVHWTRAAPDLRDIVAIRIVNEGDHRRNVFCGGEPNGSHTCLLRSV